MSPLETALIFGGIPLAVVAITYVLVFATGRRSTPRYRPGRPYEFSPVWYLAAHEDSEDHQRPVRAIETGEARLLLPPGAPGGVPGGHEHRMIKGGARGSW